MRRAIYSVFVLLLVLVVYRYRYRTLNVILRIRPLQQWMVRVGMKVPVIRNTIVSQVFREV
ncbi:hypothetical protein [Anoxybacillus sp. J5B_2022]|uniref:hypothetical protein n=1 Tax=Anoxybacillus sp. J5B_2022 TaxID=3003246 RepID=UPI0022867A7A|nr:hypothetical protein [Anoxybacillus sp. J5B_2022]MCZ0754622.1 hypothetical protein [Anoxybacillus sp. J5B_2022]